MIAVITVLASAAALQPRPAMQPSLQSSVLRLRGGEQPKTGKLWVTSTFTRDHVRFMMELPHYLGAYVGFRALPPTSIEAVMVTVNSINTCPYCTGLHGQLARMANAVVDKSAPEVVFATTFAQEAGRGPKVTAAFDKLVASLGKGKALSVRALCWALLWGKTTGNSINVVRGKLLGLQWHKISPFDLLMFLYYGPLFLVIGVLNAALTLAPSIPAWFSAFFGAILWLPQFCFIFPVGLISLVLRVLASPFVGLDL